MIRDILHGTWVQVLSPQQMEEMQSEYTIQKGEYIGPGAYWKLTYSQKCPRGCCYDSVIDLIPPEQVVQECKEKIQTYATLLKDATSQGNPNG